MATSTQRRPAVDHELKKERIELRVTASAKQIIQRAVAISGLTTGDLAFEGARRVLEEHDRMVLIFADRETFVDAVMDPPAPTKKLVAALKRHREIFLRPA